MNTIRRKKYETLSRLVVAACLVNLGSCSKSEPDGAGSAATKPEEVSPYPGTEAGARALLSAFLKSGADHAALTKPLRPTKADYAAVFDPDFAKKAEATYGKAWDGGMMVVAPKAGQTELKLWSATSDDLKQWNDKSKPFPGGYRAVAAKFKDGLTIYRFKFVQPGEELGMAYDGLLFVNGQWRLFPKPWRIGR